MPQQKIKKFRRISKELFSSLLFAVIFAFLFQSFLYQPFTIPSSSMEPTLKKGDYIFVEKFAYAYNNSSLSFFVNKLNLFGKMLEFSKPNRGDVVVFFSSNKNDDKHYIKRIVGLPGDKIQMINGLLYINSQPVNDKFVEQNLNTNNSIFEETLPNDVSYYIKKQNNINPSSFPNTTNSYHVPKEHYFMMGDNRNNSTDSRFLEPMGFIPKDNILGKSVIIFWSGDIFRNFNFNRMFKIIK